MKAMVKKYGKVAERIGARMTRAQALKLKAFAYPLTDERSHGPKSVSDRCCRKRRFLRWL